MPLLKIAHTTTYSFRNAVTFGPHRLMLRPRETRELELTAFDLEIDPPAQVEWSVDVAGNAIAIASFDAPSKRLLIRSLMVVSLNAPLWRVFQISASAASFPFDYSDDDRTDLGALAAPQYQDDDGRLTAWVHPFIMSKPTDTLSLLKDISNGIAAQIAYQSRETEGTQGPLETLDRGWGSCRDIAVLFAEAARALGFGARLVSGYIHDPTAQGYPMSPSGSTHAWTEIFVPGAGWIAFDPTNRAVGSANLVPVAVARNISQVVPVSGSFFGTGFDVPEMQVTVDVVSA